MATLLSYPAADSCRHPATADSNSKQHGHPAAWTVNTSNHLRIMWNQRGLHMTSAGSVPASIQVKLIAKGDTFPTPDEFRVAFERNMME